MFSVVRVCQSVHPQGWGSHVTITHDALDFTVQSSHEHDPGPGSPSVQGPSNTPPHHLLVTSGGQDRRPVPTCSLEDPHTGTDIWWPVSASRLCTHHTGVLPCLFKPLLPFFNIKFVSKSPPNLNYVNSTQFSPYI